MKILELSDGEASAAFLGKLFLQAGAEVVKVSRPGRPAPEPALDLYLNAGKQTVSSPWHERPGALDDLVAGCDALITDLPAATVLEHGVLDAGGDAGPAVRTSITPFGLSGPRRDWEATPATLLALGCHTWLMGDPGQTPLTLPGNYPAYHSANFAFVTTMAALLREQPAPVRVEVSELEVLSTVHQMTDAMWWGQGIIRSRQGNCWDGIEPDGLFPCADGWVGVFPPQPVWESFCWMIKRPDLITDPAFATPEARVANRPTVQATITEALSTWTREAVFHQGQATWRVPTGSVLSMGEVLADEHLRARDAWDDQPASGDAARSLRVPRLPYPRGAGGAARPAMPPASNPARPLEGVRVLDMTRVWSGPLGGRLLADLGADVIKIEAPTARGNRAVAAVAADGKRRTWNEQAVFNKLNRNRRGLAIDLKAPAGRELFLGLVRESDIVIENFSARAMPGLGLGYDTLKAVNPRIIYIAMSAFGAHGPYRDYIGYGPTIEPLTGVNSLLGYSPEELRGTSKAITDPIGGTLGAVAVMTALQERERTGQGCAIDFSQHEAGLCFIGEFIVERQIEGKERDVWGNRHARFAPNGVYRCLGSDDWIAISVRDQRDWEAFDRVVGRGWADDARFATPDLRREHAAALDTLIEAWTAEQEKFALAARLQEARVPAGPVVNVPEWLNDEHLQARGYFAVLEHPDAGAQSMDGWPALVNGDRGYADWVHAPGLGQHNAEILREILGLSAEEIATLEGQHVIVDRPPAYR